MENSKIKRGYPVFKKIEKLVTVVLCIMILVGCSSDNGNEKDPIDNPKNQTPESFSLLDITNNATDIDLKPIFNWTVAIDPDGDPVTYNFYLDSNENPTISIAENITATSFQIQESLDLINEYYWKIVAKDGQGNTTESSIFSFTTRNLNVPNEPILASANFSKRNEHTTTVFNDKLWVIGGLDTQFNHLNDVWSSSDGINWIEATNSAAFAGRRGHTTIVFDNKLWVIGGVNDINPVSTYFEDDIWYSSDGITWTEAVASEEFLERGFHDAVIFDNKIWIIGGDRIGFFHRSDVWFSSDGINWTEATPDADFAGRISHSVEVYDNKLWVIGGLGINSVHLSDVWYSTDGVNWTQSTISAEFTQRQGHSSAVFGNKLWISGGRDLNGVIPNNLWYSSDGATWTQLPSPGGFPGKLHHTTSIFNNQMWIIGGIDGATNSYSNNVWVFD